MAAAERRGKAATHADDPWRRRPGRPLPRHLPAPRPGTGRRQLWVAATTPAPAPSGRRRPRARGHGPAAVQLTRGRLLGRVVGPAQGVADVLETVESSEPPGLRYFSGRVPVRRCGDFSAIPVLEDGIAEASQYPVRIPNAVRTRDGKPVLQYADGVPSAAPGPCKTHAILAWLLPSAIPSGVEGLRYPWLAPPRLPLPLLRARARNGERRPCSSRLPRRIEPRRPPMAAARASSGPASPAAAWEPVPPMCDGWCAAVPHLAPRATPWQRAAPPSSSLPPPAGRATLLLPPSLFLLPRDRPNRAEQGSFTGQIRSIPSTISKSPRPRAPPPSQLLARPLLPWHLGPVGWEFHILRPPLPPAL
ncbi:hypothetical protein C2845_PM03G35350 [Panicum miliaceum]|uniref:Uncharacterized protein n=1 Tax=Panicum miliaceum TaxID=4540 RepID=A0A3L6T7B6_PANMI|nr:hypothetical protein C2845_PM03G35350 [Panicum miliaceum]